MAACDKTQKTVASTSSAVGGPYATQQEAQAEIAAWINLLLAAAPGVTCGDGECEGPYDTCEAVVDSWDKTEIMGPIEALAFENNNLVHRWYVVYRAGIKITYHCECKFDPIKKKKVEEAFQKLAEKFFKHRPKRPPRLKRSDIIENKWLVLHACETDVAQSTMTAQHNRIYTIKCAADADCPNGCYVFRFPKENSFGPGEWSLAQKDPVGPAGTKIQELGEREYWYQCACVTEDW